MPASTMKLLSALVALETLGNDRTFATTVVSPKTGVLVLRGGGDPLLHRRPLDRTRLAAATRRRHRRRAAQDRGDEGDPRLRRHPVRPAAAWHRHWTDNYRYSVAPITALMIDGGRTRTGEADENPAATAAAKFAARLAKAGITVTAPSR